jgi:hypothetical protein
VINNKSINREGIDEGVFVGTPAEITGLTLDGHVSAQILLRQERGMNVNGIYRLPSGRWFVVANRWFSFPPRRWFIAAVAELLFRLCQRKWRHA